MYRGFRRLLGLALAAMVVTAVPVYGAEETAAQTQEAQGTPSSMITGEAVGKQIKGESTSLVKMKYYLYTPKDATENMPLIVYLHSSVPKGQKMETILTEDLATYLQGEGKDKVPAYVLMPHGSDGWGKYEDTVLSLIDQLVETYKIDKSRISITGWSMGSKHISKFVEKRPDLFSCAAVVSGFSQRGDNMEPTEIDAMKTIPVWFLYEELGDTKGKCVELANKLKGAGGTAYTTEVPGVDHNTFLIYDGGKKDVYGVIDWMLAQKRTDK